MKPRRDRLAKARAQTRAPAWWLMIPAISMLALTGAYLIEVVAVRIGAAAAVAGLLVLAFLLHDRARRREREALQRGQERLELAIRGSNDGIWDWDIGTGEFYLSPRWKAMIGYGEHEVGDRFVEWTRRVHPEDVERLEDGIGACVQGRAELCEVEHRLQHRDGSYRWMLARGALSRDAEGNPYRMTGSLTDMTRRREAEDTLRTTERKYRSLVEQAPMVTFTYERKPDGGTHITYVSPQVEALLGYPSGRFEEDPEFWIDILYPDDRERVLAETERTDASGEAFELEYRIVHGRGHTIWVREETVLVGAESDGTTSWRGIYVDISERRETEGRLKEAEARYRNLVEQMPAMTYVESVGQPSILSYISPQLEDLFGYTLADYESDPGLWSRIIHPDDRARVLAEDERVEAADEPFIMEYRQISRDGRVHWMRDECVPIRDAEGKTLSWQGVLLDITDRKEAEEQLKEAEARYRKLVEHTPAITYTETIDGPEVTYYMSAHVEKMLGYGPEELDQKEAFWRLLHAEDRERVTLEDERAGSTGEPFEVEYRLHHKDGRVLWVKDEAVLVSRDETGKQHWQGVIFDITERKRAEQKLQEAEARYRTLVEQIPAVTYIQELEHKETVVYVSPQIVGMTGYSPEAFYADDELWYGIVHSDDLKRVAEEDRRTAATGEPFDAEYRIVHRDGHVVWVREEALLVRDAEGNPRFWQGVMSDVTERKELEGRLRHQALHDALTGLPNRALFLDRLGRAIKRRGSGRRGAGDAVAVLFMDLDNFKVVNDSLGHEAGDQLLVEMALRLTRCLRAEDTAARLGGDEFTVLLEGASDAQEAEDAATIVAQRIAKRLEVPFLIGDQEVFITTSIGIATVDSADIVPDELLRDADTAMYWAKKAGKSRHKLFNFSMNAAARERLGLENGLRRALERGEFRLHYQPTMKLQGGDVVGVEALVRWQHPERGLVFPGDFISVMEETGMIVPLGSWVFGEACRQIVAWEASMPEDYRPGTLAVGVNLSSRQFLQDDLAQEIARVLDETGLLPAQLILEINESVVMEDASRSADVLRDLKALGVRLSIDDFGTGYSSLSYLTRFPADYIKIDGSLVNGLGRDAESTAIVSAVVHLSRTLGLEMVAEGIETAEQLQGLKDLGCDLGQGYHLAKPRDAHAMRELFAQHLLL